MSNSNSFANNNNNNNNFDSIDAEFGITTNPTNNITSEVTTMINQQSTTSSMFDNLEDDVAFEYEQTTDGSAVTPVVTGLPMQQHEFNHFTTYGNTSPDVPKTLSLFFNVEHRLVSWKSPQSSKASVLNQRLLQVVEIAEPNAKGMMVSTPIITPINTDTAEGFTKVLRMIGKTITACKTVAEATKAMDALSGTIFISQWEEDEQRANKYNVAAIAGTVGNVHDAQAVIRRNEIAAFHTDAKGLILDRNDRKKLVLKTKTGEVTNLRGSAFVWVAGCLEAAIAEWGFCFSDKTNSKRAYCGDALQAVAGLSEDGIRSLVASDKEGKTYARHAMCKHISASVPNARRDNFYGQMADGQFAGHYGEQITTTYVDNSIFSTVVGDGGAVLRRALTGTITKRLDVRFNLIQLRASDSDLANAPIKEIEAKLIARICEVASLAPGETVEFEGQVVLQNGGLEVTIKPQTINSRLGFGNVEVKTIEFPLRAQTVITDFNWKLRLLWLKAMTAQNADVKLSGLEVQGDLILNANSVKNKKFMLLRMWANHFGHLIAFTKAGNVHYLTQAADGNLVLGAKVDEAKVEADLKSITKTAELTFVAHKVSVDRHKAANVKAYANAKISAADADGNVTVTTEVKTITTGIVVALELSSVAENRVISSKVSPLVADYATTFAAAEAVGTSTIHREATRQANIVELCLSDEVDASFNLQGRDFSREELVEVLKALFAKNHTQASFFKALSQKFPKGIEIKGHAGRLRVERPWTISLPTQLLAVHGRFDKAGFSHDARVESVFAFLSLIAKDLKANNAAQTLADCAFDLGKAVELWKEDVVSGKGTLTKTAKCFEQHSFKVIGNSKSAWKEIGGHYVPVIFLSETNPLTQGKTKKSLAIGKDGRNAKMVSTGDVVFFYRNPLVQLGVAVIEVVSEEVVGAYAAAIASDAFALQNCGDFDGDAINIIPAKQFGIRNVATDVSKLTDVSVTPVNQVASLMSHPLLAEGLADKAIKAYSGQDDEILGGICKVTDFSIYSNESLKVSRGGTTIPFYCGLIVDRTKQMKELNIIEELNADGNLITRTQVWVEDAEATAQHYRVRVGQGYSIMFNAVSHYVAKYRENNPLTGKDLLAVMASSVYCYEGIGLSGYSINNAKAFDLLESVAKEELGTGKRVTVQDLRTYQPISMCQGTAETKGVVNSHAWTMKPAAAFFAMCMIQSKIERDNQAGLQSHALFANACKYSAFRSLTKGMYTSPTKVSNALRCANVDSSEPYAPLLEVLVAHAKGTSPSGVAKAS